MYTLSFLAITVICFLIAIVYLTKAKTNRGKSLDPKEGPAEPLSDLKKS